MIQGKEPLWIKPYLGLVYVVMVVFVLLCGVLAAIALVALSVVKGVRV